MRVNQITIVPSAGWSTDDGKYSRGHDIGWTAEVDLVDAYVSYLADTLEQEGIRHTLLNTRKYPGIPDSSRAQAINVNTLVIHCAVGFHKNFENVALDANVSRVFYHLSSTYTLARDLAEAVGQWGELTVHGHRAGKAAQDRQDALLFPEGSQGVRVEPYLINGPSVAEYTKHMARLGRDLGNTIAAYCREVNQGVQHRTAVIR